VAPSRLADGRFLPGSLPGRARRRSLTRFSARRDLGSAWAKHIDDQRQERALLSCAAFTGTFALTRAITHAIRDGRGPFGNVETGGRHIHHMTFGIAALLATGYLWMNEVGVGAGHDGPRASRVTSGLYGAGSALTLDEFALWLNLEDDYWSQEGRKSIDAVVVFGGVLTLAALGRGLVRELVGTLASPRWLRASRRARRLAARRPGASMRALVGG